MIVFDTSVQTMTQQFEFQTEVPFFVAFPSQVVVTFLNHLDAVLSSRCIVRSGESVGISVIVHTTVITLNTIAQFQFEEVNPSIRLHESFFIDLPSSTNGTESTPTMSGSKFGRSITTNRSTSKVFTCIIILCTSEETFAHQIICAGRSNFLCSSKSIVKFADIRVIQMVVVTFQSLVFHLILCVTG